VKLEKSKLIPLEMKNPKPEEDINEFDDLGPEDEPDYVDISN
jgi:hypothetical protein